MITPTHRKPEAVLFGPVRLAFCHLTEPYAYKETEEPKYSCTIIIPKKEKATVDEVNKSIEAARKNGSLTIKEWKGKVPKNLKPTLHDGDEEKDDEAFEGMYFINAKSRRRPNLYDRDGAQITDPEELYSGVWAYVEIVFSPFNHSGSNGVGAYINGVRKHKDGERFGGGGGTSADDFAAAIGDHDDDDEEDDL